MPAASRPPVLGKAAEKIREWVADLIINAALFLLEGDKDDREKALARAAIARFIQLYSVDRQKFWVDQAQQLGASNEQVAFWLGLRPSTTSTRFPNPYQRKRAVAGGQAAAGQAAAGYAGWRRRKGGTVSGEKSADAGAGKDRGGGHRGFGGDAQGGGGDTEQT